MITNTVKNFCLKSGNSIIVLFWLLFFLLHLYLYGIVTTFEAAKYIKEAERLINYQTLSATRFWFYSITIFIITISLKLKIGFTGAVIIQSLLNLLTILFFHRSLKLIFPKFSLFPLIIIAITIAFLPYSSWNVFLYTESVFYNSILFLTSAIIRHNYTKKKLIVFLIIFALVVTILSRPLGILFIPAVLFYFYVSLEKKARLIIIPAGIIGLGVLVYATNIVFTTTTDATITLSAKEGCVVCGVLPATNVKLNLLTAGSPLQQLYYYVSHNFSHFITLGFARLNAFFFMTRPYYSARHNIFLLAFIIPLYILSGISFVIKKESRYKPVFYFMVVSIITFAIVIMLQCDDYHNRFILGLFPFLLILSGKTTIWLVSKKN